MVMHNSLMYWWGATKSERTVSRLQREIIEEYQKQTGIHASTRHDLEEAFKVKNMVAEETQNELNACLKANKRLKFGNKLLKIGLPITFGLGVAAGVWIMK